jgi:hypothetical protein
MVWWKLESLNGLIRSLPFLGIKGLSYFGISSLPARSTLADANRNHKSDVFGTFNNLFVAYYHPNFRIVILLDYYKKSNSQYLLKKS